MHSGGEVQFCFVLFTWYQVSVFPSILDGSEQVLQTSFGFYAYLEMTRNYFLQYDSRVPPLDATQSGVLQHRFRMLLLLTAYKFRHVGLLLLTYDAFLGILG
jgi:hypothetical protein